MASFMKRPGQSVKGWEAAASRQTLGLGQDAQITLFGAAPSGEALLVNPVDPTVCTIHELPAVPGAQGRNFTITALKAGDCRIQARTKSGVAHATLVVHVTGSMHGVKLVFFPGERSADDCTLGTIYVIGGNGERYSAAGGEPAGYKDRGGHYVDPTPKGKYIVGQKQHVVAPSWPMSAIPWGAALRVNSQGECEYEGLDKVWRLATGPSGVVTKAQVAFNQRDRNNVPFNQVVDYIREVFIDPKTKKLLTPTWELNDFGRWGWNLTKNGGGTPYFIHTTPDNEHATAQGKAVLLANSHGCVHLKPNDRDEMIRLGYLQKGVEFEVRSYAESGPPQSLKEYVGS